MLCPACGVTRALISLFKGKFSDYCYYNIFAIPLFLATIFMITGTKYNIKLLKMISVCILVINIPYYFFRLFNGLIP